MSFEQWLQANHFGDGAALTDGQRTALLTAWKKDSLPAPEPPAPAPAKGPGTFADAMRDAEAEQARQTRITEIAALVMNDNPGLIELVRGLGEQAITGKWTVEHFELEILRAQRPAGPHPAMLRSEETPLEVIEAAVCRTGQLPALEKR